MFTAELAIFARAVTAMTCNDENLVLTVSTLLLNPDMSTRLAAALTSFKPLDAPFKSKLLFNLFIVSILVLTFFSNCWLSNCIDTTRSSTVLLIA